MSTGPETWGDRFKWLIDRVITYLTGTAARPLIFLGSSLLTIDKWDVFVYALRLALQKEHVTPPGYGLDAPGYIGVAMILGGVWISLRSASAVAIKDRHQEIAVFFASYKSYSPPQLQQEMNRLFDTEHASVSATLLVLGHPDNPSGAAALFKRCHSDVVSDGAWLKLKDKRHKFYYWTNNLFALFVGVSALTFFVAAAAEWARPGSMGAANGAWFLLLLLGLAEFAGLCVLGIDLRRRGAAITLVEEMRPAP